MAQIFHFFQQDLQLWYLFKGKAFDMSPIATMVKSMERKLRQGSSQLW